MAKTIALFNNKLIKVDNKIGLYPSCCCGETPPGCECPENCVPGLIFSLNGIDSNPVCFDPGGFYQDEISCGENGQITLAARCEEGVWKIGVQVACFTENGFCFAQYKADLDCEDDNLPPAGNVDLILEFENIANCFPVPVVTITKS